VGCVDLGVARRGDWHAGERRDQDRVAAPCARGRLDDIGDLPRVARVLVGYLVRVEREVPRIRGRVVLDRDRERQRTDLDEVAILKRAGLGQRLAVDERPVAAPEVANNDPLVADPELGVLAADPFAVRTQVTGLTAADPEYRAGKRDRFPFILSLDDD